MYTRTHGRGPVGKSFLGKGGGGDCLVGFQRFGAL